MCINCQQNNNIFTPNGVQGFNGGYGGYSSAWLFDGSAISSSPGSTLLRFNSVTISSVTNIYINKTNRDNNDLSGFLVSFINSGNYGLIRIFNEFNSSIFADFKITNISLSGNVYTLTVIYITSVNTFNTNDSVVVSFTQSPIINSNSIVLLGKRTGINMNLTSDQLINISGGTNYIITDIIITNSSVNLSSGTIAKGYFYSGTSRSGIEIAAPPTASLQILINSISYIGNKSNLIVLVDNTICGVNTVYFSLNTGHGSAATADVYIYGYILN